MNREKEDQLPMMQVGFIDSICLPIYEVHKKKVSIKKIIFILNFNTTLTIIYIIKNNLYFLFILAFIYIKCYFLYFYFMITQAFALLSDKLNPLVEGVRQNKQHWLEIAEDTCSSNCTNHDRTTVSQDNSEEIKRDGVLVE